MAIDINHIMLACKHPDSCKSAALLTKRLATAFGGKVTALCGDEAKSVIISEAIPNLEIISLDGSPFKVIKQKSKELNPDLIVLPISSSDAPEAILTGKEANSIIDHIERMVLTVPAGNKDFKFDKIVVPIDTSFETRQKVPYAEVLAKKFGSTLYVLGVSSDKGKDAEVTVNNYTRQVCRNIDEQGIAFKSEISLGGNPTDITLAYAQKVGASLIIIMTEQESNLISFFSGKYSEQMVKKSNIPVLSIHPKDLIVSEARL
jgi:nucleotide-binding universal stress UspA family protein